MTEAAVKIYSDNWVATVLVSSHSDASGFFHVYCTTIGASFVDAVNAANHVLKAYAWDRTAFIRAEPEANSETDFDTKIIHHKGYVRFSYKLERGIWHYPEKDTMTKVGFGALP